MKITNTYLIAPLVAAKHISTTNKVFKQDTHKHRIIKRIST